MRGKIKKHWYYFVAMLLVVATFSALQVGAATATTFSDSLSDSRPSTASNHTIVWDAVDAISEGDAIILTFDSNFDTASIVEDDVDISASGKGELTTATDCTGSEQVQVVMAADVLTMTTCGGGDFGADIAAAEIVTVEIGTNATSSGTGSNQITNPTANSYTIALSGTGYTDTGEVQVAIISGVTTTATVSASLSVSVASVADTQTVNGQDLDITSTSSTMPFATLVVNTYKAGAHDITISTNAAEGYTTSIRQVDGTGMTNILASGGNNIDGFRGAGGTATNAAPLAWAAGTNPPGVAANTNTGWYGYTTEDSSLGTGTADRFTNPGNYWAPFDIAPYEVAYASAPVNAEVTRVGHMIEVNALQPQGVYSGIIEYIVTAIF